MKKDHIRDYATEAFRYYALCGCKTSAQIKQELYDRIYEQSKREYHTITKGMCGSSTEYAVMAAEKAMEQHEAEIRDIMAVENTLLGLGMQERKAVAVVYFESPKQELQKGDISDRVHKAELAIPASERQIYYWLSKARRLFARNRGLRLQTLQ